ncbi:MAG: hypothetical protein GXY03_02485 [Solirubrobacterales bacterium]|nr:hypothetical protein [Solirubrobacterales bacterium]
MTGRTTDDSRLAILLLDYEACREDERTSVLVQATMFTAAIALLGLVAAAVTQTCAFDPDRDRCTPVNHYLLASAPLLPYAVIVFVYSIGLMGNIRTYYLRALEAELRTYLPTAFRAAGTTAIGPASLHELAQNVVSLRRGRKGYILMLCALVTGVFVVFLGLTVYIATHIDGGARKAMLVVYPPLLLLALYESYFGLVNGRGVFLVALRKFRARRHHSPLPQDLTPAIDERSLFSYLLLPRPEDTVKWVFIPGAYALAAWSLGSTGDLLRLAALWVIAELLLYEARYQWNDLRDYDKDLEHSWASARRRLPHGDGFLRTKRRNALASITAIGARILMAVGLALALDLVVETAVAAVLIFGIGLAYERLKSLNGTRLSLEQTRLDVAIWIVVGLGYGVRGAIGMYAAGIAVTSAAFALGAGALVAFGTVFVLLTWTLEATSFCVLDSKGRLAGRGLDSRPHLAALLPYAGLRPVIARAAPDEPIDQTEISFNKWTTLEPRGQTTAPWNVAMIAAGLLAGALGATLVDASRESLLYLAPAVGAASATSITFANSTNKRLAIAAWGAVSLTLLAIGAGADPLPLVAIPWTVFALTYASFRAQSYSKLKNPLDGLPQALDDLALWLMRPIVGKRTHDSLRGEPDGDLRNTRDVAN